MKLLVSAYSCGPWPTSEPGNAWRAVKHALALGHEVWTITESSGYEEPTMKYLAEHPMPGYHPHFFCLSEPFVRLRRQEMIGSVYYHLWQRKLLGVARELHEKVGFDLAHHVTFGRYWSPSGVRDLGIPFLWGPVGAAESAPSSFLAELPLRERAFEFIRDSVRTISHLDPALRDTAAKATIALGITRESCEGIRQLGAERVEQIPQGALSEKELATFDQVPPPPAGPFRAICIGRLLHWKGFYLAIRAFAIFAKKNPDAELWIVGSGPFEAELKKTAAKTGMASKIRFLGHLSHAAAMEQLALAHVLIHPALHEAFGNVCLEAMASGRPVICLDIGGPASQVTAETGCVVPPTTPGEAIEKMAAFLSTMDQDRALLAKLSEKARAHVRKEFSMRKIGEALEAFTNQAVALHRESRAKKP